MNDGWKRRGVERVEEEGNGTLAPSAYFPRSTSILNLCVYTHYTLAGVIDLSSMISSPCFLSSFSFFFYNRYPYFTLDCYRLIGGNELKRIINLVEICYRSTWIKLIRDVINR